MPIISDIGSGHNTNRPVHSEKLPPMLLEQKESMERAQKYSFTWKRRRKSREGEGGINSHDEM
ncbi:hypothetical protein KSB_50620 [Ktedonobacter robiniae]|uniref:Uncharacterized protein n=1 Tax=Ktedonobacter robiniae TaxID=2778365 RepID=A0ABQ3UV74_9CHLR|nr:hypothetical protein KSB_50620 [Ktedonobacter robiniae]